ncbi:class D beta-lactamase [Hymenobacter amundsenii]|uniref:Beta-lactamase n=1 Tax=Hymenobacter amundsenii TaxID=2006685 RepID=A0A2D0AFR2_9BACT|nr:penicillin-binding transpeptidase domain-containing protein [Hymenobacter amundsenii]OWP63206.1 class D beta-lactamase [Hymenobacter amundsenii]
MLRNPLLLLWLLLPGLLSSSTRLQAPTMTQRDFEPYFLRQGVEGSFLLYDAPARQFVAYRPDRCREGFLPASTFKIPNTLIGLATGALRDTSEICRWDGVTRDFPQWNQDMPFARALRVSAVPCYQQLARRIGVPAYRTWLRKLGYPGMVVTESTLDTFWLDGKSRITQFQQIDFLSRLQAEVLPVAKQHQRAVKQLLILKKTPQYTLYGKTGWRFRSARNPDNAWLVGWIERADGRKAFFALNVKPAGGQPADARFAASRRIITDAILQELGWMK